MLTQVKRDVAADVLRHRIEERFGWACRVPGYLERYPLA
jgi:hypothetical protein